MCPTVVSTRVRSDQAEDVELKGTEGGFAPFFSPDGRAIGFFAGRELRTLTFSSGAITKVSDAGILARSGSWGDNGVIVGDLSLDGLSVVPEAGGTPVPLISRDGDARDIAHRNPFVLPGGGAVLFGAVTSTGDSEVRVVSLPDRRVRTLHAGGSPRFVPTSETGGFLLFVEATNLLAARFRLDTLSLEGEPVAV